MPTGNKRTNLVDKRHMPQQRVKDTFFDYLAEEIWETAHRIWGSRRGVFGEAILQGDGTDRFKVDDLPIELLDGEGHILILEAADAEEVYLQNTVGVTYYVAGRHCLIPTGIQRNPRTGVLFYDLLEDRVGLSGIPTSLTQVAGTIRLNVDSIFESGVSHAGRKVTVWLNLPRTTEETIAIERDLTVLWEGGSNVVYTVGLLGQGAVSLTAADYGVAATGLTVRRNTNLRTTEPYAFLGTATGAGAGIEPTAFNTTQQIDVTSGLNPTLDMAYNGGPDMIGGNGRSIVVDAGAVELNSQSVLPGDSHNAQLRLNRLGDTSWGQIGLEVLSGDISHIPISTFQPVQDGGGTLLIAEPAALSGANIIDLTRIGIDITDPINRINKKLHIVLLEDCSQAGLYAIESFSATQILVKRFSGGLPLSWPSGTATIRILIPRFVLGGSHPVSGACDWWTGPLFVLRDGFQGYQCTLRIMPEGNGRVVIYDNSKTGMTSYFEPREMIIIDPSDVGQNLQWPTRFKRSVLICGGDASEGSGQEIAYNRDGLRIYDAGGSIEERDSAFAFCVDAGWPEDVPTLHTLPSFAVETTGAVDRGHHLRDDFIAYPHGSIGSGIGPYYTFYAPNPGTAYVRDISDGAGYGHGCIDLVTGGVISDVAEFGLDSLAFNLDTSFDFRWIYRSRIKVGSIADVKVVHGFYRCTSLRRFYFVLNHVTNEYAWRGGWQNPDGTYHVTDPICGLTVDQYQWFEIHITANMVFFIVERKDHAVNSYGNASASIPTLDGQSGALGINIMMQTQTNSVKSAVLDYWEVWDQEVLVGRHGASHNLLHGT
jgi:hypothetical protein